MYNLETKIFSKLFVRKCVLFMFAIRAAYKGFSDTVRLLLFRDACQGRQDKEGIIIQ